MKKVYILFICLLSLLVQGQVSKTINLTTAGTLSSQLTTTEKSSITNLTVTGSIDARDFKCMRDEVVNLTVLDISATVIAAYSGIDGTSIYGNIVAYKENEMPQMSFYNDYHDRNLKLTTVTLPNSIVAIGNSAFSGCKSLTGTFVIPNTVTYIDYDAFWRCPGIASISLGKAVSFIGSSAFGHCYSLSSFSVSSENLNYSAIDGVLFNKNQNKLFFYPSGKGGFYTIPSSVDSIAEESFFSASGLMLTLTIPKKVTYIEYGAFNDCKNLSELNVDPENPNYSSLNGALYNKDQTILIKCPTGKYGSYTVPASVLTINGAFENCKRLDQINVEPTNPNYSSINGILFNKDQTTLIQYPLGRFTNYTVPSTVTTIGACAFRYGELLTSITFPTNLKTIGAAAFQTCTGLSGNLILPKSLKTIDFYAFTDCSGLVGNLVLPDSLSGLDTYVFSGCTGISGKLIIPSAVKYISVGTFSDCKQLSELYIPADSIRLSGTSFQYCTGLKKITSDQVYPPKINATTFLNVDKSNCKLTVPVGSLASYKIAPYWSEFFHASEAFSIQVQIGLNGNVTENSKNLTTGAIVSVDSTFTKAFSFTPNAGYEISTLTYNGVDVKSQIVNNQYTTPPVTANGILNITFKKTVYKISVQLGGSGTMNLNYYYGDTPSFDFTPSQGAKIQSVFYNGVDVIADLVGNVYTLPAITANGTLKVVFVSNATGVNATIDSGIYVFKSGSDIYVKGTSAGEQISLFSVDGKLLQTIKSTAQGAVIQVQTGGTYLIRIKQKTYKVLV